MFLSCTVSEMWRDIGQKLPTLTYPHRFLAPPYGVTSVEFQKDSWRQKTRVNLLSCGVIFVILGLAALVQHRVVTDGHRAITYSALA